MSYIQPAVWLVKTSTGVYQLVSDGSSTLTFQSAASTNLSIGPVAAQSCFMSGPWQQGGPFTVTDRMAVALTAITTTGSIAFNAGPFVTISNAGATTVTLPAANTVNALSMLLRIKNIGAGTTTITRAGTDLIDGATTAALTTKQSIDLQSDGSSNWWIV